MEPFTFHWYEGVVPPLVGVAVNVADDPVQSGFDPPVCEIATLGTTVVLTVIVTAELVAVVGAAQVALLVNTQVTACPLVIVDVV